MPGWNVPAMNGAVRDVIMDDGRLYVGGTFTTVGGVVQRGEPIMSIVPSSD